MVSTNRGKILSKNPKNLAPDQSFKEQKSSTYLGKGISSNENIQLYQCTYPNCHSSFGSKSKWEMHEKEHWPLVCYLCPFCATTKQDFIQNQQCIGCSRGFDSQFNIGVAASHILECKLAQEQSQKFTHYDTLRAHLRTRHDIKNIDIPIPSIALPINGNWPKDCGFCDAKFTQWESRVDHIEAHYLRGDNTPEPPSHFLGSAGINLSSMFKSGDAWNATCLADPSMSNFRSEILGASGDIEMIFPDDCPAMVTGTAIGHCSCTGIQLSASKGWIHLQCISRALHASRTRSLLRATGEWLFQTPEFMDWRNLPNHSYLQLYGKLGSGKSVLASAVIQHLKEVDKRNNEIVAFCCCDGRYKNSYSVLDILAVWLAELQARRASDSVVARLMENMMDLESLQGQLSLSTLRGLFQTIKHNLMQGETLVLILDGLDDAKLRDSLQQELSTLTDRHENFHCVKVFFTSRAEIATESRTPTWAQINIAQPSIVEDMKEYTDSIVSKNLVPEDLMMAIWRATEKSQGRYLCMRLLLHIYSQHTASPDANDWLLRIMGDRGIDGPFAIFEFMYESIPESYHQLALCMLKWVLHATRPLYVDELLDAVNLELGTNYVYTDIDKATRGLLVISRAKTVNLVNPSLHEYLLSTEWSSFFRNSQKTITKTLLQALSSKLLLQSLGQPWSSDYTAAIQQKQLQALEVYAMKHWIYHFFLAESESNSISGLLHEILRNIFRTRNSTSRDTTQSDSIIPKSLLEIELARLEVSPIETINILLRIGASNGFYDFAKLQLDMGATDHVFSSFSENSLHLASIGGHPRLAKLLLEYGADLNHCCSSGFTPLFHAIVNGHHEVEQLLRNSGALSAANTAQNSEAMEDLIMETATSKKICICGQHKTSFTISIKAPGISDDATELIVVKEDRYLPSNANLEEIHGDEANHTIRIKWFPGISMYRALALTANLGIDHTQKLLLEAGNTLDQISVLCQNFQNMAVA